jgi:hypothetical protein
MAISALKCTLRVRIYVIKPFKFNSVKHKNAHLRNCRKWSSMCMDSICVIYFTPFLSGQTLLVICQLFTSSILALMCVHMYTMDSIPCFNILIDYVLLCLRHFLFDLLSPHLSKLSTSVQSRFESHPPPPFSVNF